MKKSNIYVKGPSREINPNWFTGKVRMKVVSREIKSKDHDIYHVYFDQGAITKIHWHNGDQILLVTRGEGMLETFTKFGNGVKQFKIKKDKRANLREGDMVFIPAKTLHIHGSTSKKKTFSHVAINIIPKKSSVYKTFWYESDFKRNVTDLIK